MNIDRGALRGLWQEAFGDTDAFLDDFWSTAYSPARCQCLTRDGQIAAALYWLDCEYAGGKLAYLYAVATAARFRGQGLCHALMADTHRRLSALGYRGTILVPGDGALFRLYRDMGYETCAQIGQLACVPGPEAAALRRIGAEEYGAARRGLLPPGGVLQEGENLVFLEAQAELYTGPGLLLAVRRQGDTLEGLELLGDPAAAPGILRGLGCKAGTFRIPGPGRDFAMYRPLAHGPAPSYFGLAFD